MGTMQQMMLDQEVEEGIHKLMLRMMTLHLLNPGWDIRKLELEANESFYEEEQDERLAYLLSKDD